MYILQCIVKYLYRLEEKAKKYWTQSKTFEHGQKIFELANGLGKPVVLKLIMLSITPSRYLSALGFWNIEFEKSSLMNLIFCLPYARHHKLLLIRSRPWIQAIHKDRIFWKNLLKNKEMVFGNGVKNYTSRSF